MATGSDAAAVEAVFYTDTGPCCNHMLQQRPHWRCSCHPFPLPGAAATPIATTVPQLQRAAITLPSVKLSSNGMPCSHASRPMPELARQMPQGTCHSSVCCRLQKRLQRRLRVLLLPLAEPRLQHAGSTTQRLAAATAQGAAPAQPPDCPTSRDTPTPHQRRSAPQPAPGPAGAATDCSTGCGFGCGGCGSGDCLAVRRRRRGLCCSKRPRASHPRAMTPA